MEVWGRSRLVSRDEFQALMRLPHSQRHCCDEEKGVSPLRLNVYAEEVSGEVQLTKKTSEQGQDFYGVRVFLASPDVLHHTPEDDDRSAVTFWVPWTAAGGQDTGHLAQVFQEALRHLGNIPTTTKEGQ